MTKIKIKKLLIHNFLSFKDEEWDFSNTSRLVLVKGVNKDTESPKGCTSNGSGKTSWSHALMYALFGQLTDSKFHNAKLKNQHSDHVVDGYKMSVTVEVDTIYSKTKVKHWKIVRGIPRTTTVNLQLFELDDDGEWKDISKSSSANTQKFMDDNVLHMNFDMYQRLVMLCVDDRFNFFKLNAAQKREFVETLFDTSVYSNMYKLMSDDIKSGNLLLQNLKVNKVKLEKTKEVCEDEIAKYKAGVNDQIANTTRERDDAQEKVDSFDPLIEAVLEQRNEIQIALTKVRENRKKLESLISSCNTTMTDAKIAISNYNSTISHHERELNKHKEVLGMICKDCQDVVNKFYSLDVYREEIEKLKGQIGEKEQIIESSESQIAKVRVCDEKLGNEERKRITELSDSQVKERNLQFQKSQLIGNVKTLEKKISDLTESIENENKIPTYSVYRKTLDEISEVEKELSSEVSRMFLLKLGSDIISPTAIKKNIISRVVASINTMINANLSQLNVNFTCELAQDMNDYQLFSDGEEVDLGLRSAGEKMKLLISTQLAFRKFLMSRFNVGMNVMIIDEVVDKALDSVSIHTLLEMLLQLSQKENTNISIISHREEVEDMFKDIPETQLVVIQKENKISTIIREQKEGEN